MSAGDYVLGLLLFGWVAVASSAFALVLVRRRLGHLDRLEASLAGALVAIVALLVIHMVPLALGILARGSVAVMCAVACVAAALIPKAGPSSESATPRPAPAASTRLSWAVAAVTAGAWLVALVANVREWLPRSLVGVDTQTFHLPNVARWIETGSLWQIDEFVPLQAHGYYPNNGDVLLLAGVLPWHNDFFVRVPMIALLIALPVALWAVARELGAPPAAAAIAAIVPVSAPIIVTSVVPRAMPDVLLGFALAVSLLFLLRHARTHMRSDLVLAALGLGVALGTKWYGLTTLVIALAVAGGAWLLVARRTARTDGAPRGGWWRPPVVDVAVAGAIAVAGGAVWLLRNLIEVGNPAFPLKLAPFGITILDAPPDVVADQVGFPIAHYLGDPGVLFGDIPREIEQGLGFVPVVLAIGVILAAVWLWCDRVRDGRVVALVVAAVLLAGVYVITPYTALGFDGEPALANFNTRYLLPGLLVAAVVTAWAVGRLGRAGVALEAAMALVVLVNLPEAFKPLDAKRAVVAAGALALAAGVAAAAALVGRRAGWERLRPAAAVAAALVVVVAAAAYGWRTQERLNGLRYSADGEETIVALSRWLDDRQGHVAIAGDWNANGTSPVWVSFGARLNGRVSMIGYDADGFLTNYSDPRGFSEALSKVRPDMLVVGRGLTPPAEGMPREERWARAAGWRPVARSERLVLLQPPS